MVFDYHTIVSLTLIAGFLMAYGIGANDVANAMATSVGAKALTMTQALCVAAVFEFLGAFLAGGEVTKTIRKGIVPETAFGSGDILILAMLAALLSAGLWLLVASWKGWPVSTTHSIVGAIVGVAIASAGFSSVEWEKVLEIMASWIISPLLAGSLAFALGFFVRKQVIESKDPLAQAKRIVPYLVFLTAFMVAGVMFLKGLKNVGLEISTAGSLSIAFIIAAISGFLSKVKIAKVKTDDGDETKAVERVFIYLMIVTACAMAFAHGSNDVANAIGPVAAILGVIASDGEISSTSVFSKSWLAVGAVGIVVGLLTLGRQVMKRVGEKITMLTPSRGFAAELAAAGTVVTASILGLPISTTHTLVGAVIGVGLTTLSFKGVQWGSVKTIVASWLVTLPIGAGLAAMIFLVLKAIML